MGTFLIDEGVGPSGPRFFKFEPAGNAPYTARGVGIFAQKLPHVTRGYTGVSRDRSLLVTPSATGNRPVALGAFLLVKLAAGMVPHLGLRQPVGRRRVVGDVRQASDELGYLV